jgi:UDP-2,4-diacetamido-2,4,6-trideoxy-beta-L-altropyranose hydrolase
MRCLTLADALATAGVRCRFVCRNLPGHLAGRIADRGYPVDLLTGTEDSPTEGPPPHAGWLPVPQKRDAAETLAAMGGEIADWVIVDHYALDARWEARLRPAARRIMVIDDLADRPHECEFLLDQTLGRDRSAYNGLVPKKGHNCIGAQFALLRPDFTRLRPESLSRRRNGDLRGVLVAMGGTDSENLTGQVLNRLSREARDLSVTVALGSAAPHLDDVRKQALQMGARIEVDTSDIAKHMASADLAIGAGGTMSWERACLGLPALLVIAAENQTDSARALAAAGTARLLGRWDDPGWPAELSRALCDLRDPGRLAAMSRAAAAVVDGGGTERVVARILAHSVDLRPAARKDAPTVWEWRRAGDAARFYRAGTETTLHDHLDWFARALADRERDLMIAEHAGRPVGHLRLDWNGQEATLSICLAPDMRGRRLARACLEAAYFVAKERGCTRIAAEIHKGNTASIRLFESAGYHFRSQDRAFMRYERSTGCHISAHPGNGSEEPCR